MKKVKDYALSKNSWLFVILLLISVSAGAQSIYYGYVGDPIKLPKIEDKGDWVFYDASYGTDCCDIEVESTIGWVTILNYFEGYATINCTYRMIRTYTQGTGTYTDIETSTTYYYVSCIPVMLTGIPDQINLKTGESQKITYSANPYDHWPQVGFVTYDPKVATVDASGNVTGVSEGSTYISVENSKGPNEIVFVYVTEDSNPVVYADVESGRVLKGTRVTLSCNKDDADIYYTTDGTSPSKNSFRYVSPIVINQALTLKAIAYYGDKQSPILERNFTISQESNEEELSIARNSIAAGLGYTLFIKSDGSLWGCGSNSCGQLGDGTTTERTTPVKIMDDVASVSAGALHSLILRNDGTLWTCGMNDYGQLGDGTKTDKTNPIKIMGNVLDISACGYFSLILKKDGTLWTCGRNDYGQLGDGTRTDRATPVKVMSNVISISAGYQHALALKNDGTLWGCGYNFDGELGDPDGKLGDENSRYCYWFKNFVKIAEDVIYMKACGDASYMIKSDGILWACGNTQISDVRTFAITNMDDVISVSGGSSYSLFLKADGSVWSCGDNRDGQLGNEDYSTTTPVEAPIEVMRDVTTTAAAFYTSLFLKKDGTLWGCGNNEHGQLGTGTTSKMEIYPVRIAEDVGFMKPDYDITLSPLGYATFYASKSAYTLPNGLSAQVVTGVSNGKLTYHTLVDNLVPQGTAVMLTSSSKTSAAYTLTPSESTATYDGTNLLYGSDEATTTTGNGYHYKLSYGKTGTTWSDVFGWYWGAQDGAPFQIDGHKAWLVVPSGSTRAAGFTIDGDATEIIDIESGNEAHDIYYDMQGRRIGTSTRSGIYIKNGKKVIIK